MDLFYHPPKARKSKTTDKVCLWFLALGLLYVAAQLIRAKVENVCEITTLNF
jgi:hypothetical protein